MRDVDVALVLMSAMTLVFVVWIFRVDKLDDKLEGDAARDSDDDAESLSRISQSSIADALGAIIAYGTLLRRCAACASQKTDSNQVGYRVDADGEPFVLIVEDCLDCNASHRYRAHARDWCAMECVRIWDAGRTARSLARSERSDDLTLE